MTTFQSWFSFACHTYPLLTRYLLQEPSWGSGRVCSSWRFAIRLSAVINERVSFLNHVEQEYQGFWMRLLGLIVRILWTQFFLFTWKTLAVSSAFSNMESKLKLPLRVFSGFTVVAFNWLLVCVGLLLKVLLNIMFHASIGRFQLELFIFITYFSTIVPFNSCVFFPISLSLLVWHFQQVL